MKHFILALTLFSSPLAFSQHSQYKGFAAIGKELSTRLAPHGESLDMYDYVPAEGLDALLGTWFTYGSEHVFKNGSPNPVNILIWYVTLSDFSKAMGGSCASPKMNLSKEFLAVLNKICDWPKEKATAETVMLDFWLAVMGYNAPETEFVEWREFFLKSSYKSKTAKETVTAMTLAITMNPYFLLGR